MGSDASLRFELFSRDVAGLRDFLERALGFVVARNDAGYVEMRLGAVTIGLGATDALPAGHPLRPADPDERLGLGVEIVIETDDVDAAYDHARASGYPVSLALGQRPWGGRDFRLVAPDGYYFRVTSRS